MDRKLLSITFLGGIMLAGILSCDNTPDHLRHLRSLPIQNGGRIKSFESFSRETLKLITGRETRNGEPPVKTILDAVARRDAIDAIPWVRIDHRELKQTLGLKEEEEYFAMSRLLPLKEKVVNLVMASQMKREGDLRPTAAEQNSELLYSRMNAVERLKSGDVLRVIPAGTDEPWRSPFDTESPQSAEFRKIAECYAKGESSSVADLTARWNSSILAQSEEAAHAKLSLELRYYDLSPFQFALIGYFLTAVLFAFGGNRPLVRWVGFAALTIAFCAHSAGMVMRVLILERPPVSNMYESMIFMNWILIVFAAGFALIRKQLSVLTVGALLSGLVMTYANLLTIDSDLGVLQAVLRTNYWLVIHVLTIVSSYGALGLAMGLGHRHVFMDVFHKFTKESEQASAQTIYLVLQIGVILVGIGTILGGVWASESWGRFWGWDPKETWALITFLGYLIVIHLRYKRRLGNFALAISSIVGFLLVLMTWYGVNFVLGRGLHSYGSGAGGMFWITIYLVFEASFVALILIKKNLRPTPDSPNQSAGSV